MRSKKDTNWTLVPGSQRDIDAVRERRNIVIAGGTASGKTTLANALIRADRDFELLIIPGSDHGAAESPYGQRRRMEHLVWMDTNVIPGAFYAEAVWFWPQPQIIDPEAAKKHPGIPPHSHPFPELLSY